MKKVLLSSIAAFSLLIVSAEADGMKCGAGKCGAAMKQGAAKQMTKHKKHKQSPFLIKHGLPHLTKMVAKSWDDAQLALTPEQKAKLTEVRKTTMSGVKRLKPEVMKLQKEIVEASKAGTKADTLKAKVEKLASLEAEATMVHLNCIDNTKAILTKAQYDYLMQKRIAHKAKHKTSKTSAADGMKCATGKCGGK